MMMEIRDIVLTFLSSAIPPTVEWIDEWIQGSPLDQAVRATAKQFPQIEGLGTSLKRWIKDPRAVSELQRAREGETNQVDETTLTEALLNCDFHGHDDPTAEARQVVTAFFQIFERKILESPTPAEFIVGTIRGAETRYEARHTRVLEAIKEVSHQVTSLASTASREKDPASPTDTKIDVARDRLLAGYPRTALGILNEIDAGLNRAEVPVRTVFRLLTNRACCHFELGNEQEGVSGFEAAYHLQPNEPKAKANLALARLIRGQTEDAERITREVLREDPTRPDALGVLAQLLDRRGDRDQAVDVLRPYVGDRGVQTALAMLLLRAGRCEEVQELLTQVPTENRTVQETLLLAEAYVEMAERYLKNVNPFPSQLPPEILTGVTSVEGLLTPVVEQARPERSRVLLPALTVRAAGRFITRRLPEAIEDLEEASGLPGAPDEVLRNLGLFYTAHGDFPSAVATFQRVLTAFPTSQHELRPLLVEALVANKQVEDAIREGANAWAEASSPDSRRAAGLAYATALAAAGNGAEAGAIIDILRHELPDDPSIDLGWAEVLGRLGKHEEAIAVLEGQLAKAEGSRKIVVCMELGDAYARCGRFDDAANIYRSVAHPVDCPDTFRRYLVALYESGRWAEALDAAKTARQIRGGAWPPVPEAEIEGHILEVLGNLPDARRLYEGVLKSRGHDPIIEIRLAEVLLRQDELTAAKVSLDSAVQGFTGEARSLLRAGQLYSAMVEAMSALRCAYEAVTISPDDPKVSMGFIGMMFGRPESITAELECESARPGCVVQVEVDGTTLRFRILEEGETVTGSEDLRPAEPLATRLLGRHTGDSVVLQEGPHVTRDGVIRAILHKYVAKFQDILAQYPIRHAQEGGLAAIPAREDLLDKVRAMVRQREDYTKRLFKAYKEMPLPIGILATKFEKTAWETLLALAREPNMPIISRDGSPDAARRAREVLAQAGTLVLDPTALATLALLNLTELPRQLGVRVVVPQSFLDELYREILKRRAFAGREYMVLSAEGDVLTRRVVTPEQHEMGTQTLTRARDLAKGLDISPRPAISGKWSEWGDREVFGPDSADAVAIAHASGAVLVSADERLMAAVRNTWGIKTASVFDLVEHFARKGLISGDVLEEVTTTLVAYGFTHIPVRASTLIHAIRGSSYEPSQRWEALLNVLADPSTDEESSIRVIINFMGELDSLLIIPPSIERLMRDCFEAVVRHRNTQVLEKVQRYVSANVRISKLMRRLIREATIRVKQSVEEGRIVRS